MVVWYCHYSDDSDNNVGVAKNIPVLGGRNIETRIRMTTSHNETRMMMTRKKKSKQPDDQQQQSSTTSIVTNGTGTGMGRR
mmetsp:Transcript_1263/g.1346  ORF Transcript_1263/g.1346 Transcript_1263/m.1346 type:complete len:81 (+) Transcript_1263:948-1190(+)